MTRPLEWIIRKQQSAPLPGLIPATPIDPPATDIIFTEAASNHLPIVLAFAQRGKPRRSQIWFAASTHAEQAGRRPHFNDDGRPRFGYAGHAGRELNRVAQMIAPVTGRRRFSH